MKENDYEHCLLNDKKTIITTLTNFGYILYTLNMLKSLKQFGLDKNVFIVCIDTKSSVILQKLGYKTFCIDDSELGVFCPWNTKGYDKICFLKLELIYRLLSLNKNVILIDGDIVFRKNPYDDINAFINDTKYDVWIQNDSLEDNNMIYMCTGYMFIKTNDKLINLYDCVSAKGRKKYLRCAFNNNDQTYFNRYVKPYCLTYGLPLEKYPNGQMYYANYKKIDDLAILVHFNWVTGHDKMAKMKEHKMWLLTPDEEEEI